MKSRSRRAYHKLWDAWLEEINGYITVRSHSYLIGKAGAQLIAYRGNRRKVP